MSIGYSVATPSLTLIILADRSEPLTGMLAHHRSLADEIVVVDTGGGEATAAATAAGARAVHHPWQDDFAAARNTGLAAATGDWILSLDPDGLVAPADFEPLRAALCEPPAVRLLTTVNYCPDSRHPEWRPVTGRYPRQEAGQTGCFLTERGGLFPRRRGLVWQGRIHETVLPSAAQQELPVVSLPEVQVHHYGFVLTSEHDEARRKRYGRMVRREFADRPGDLGAILDLATVLLEEGDLTAARRLLEDLAAAEPADSAVTRGRFLLGRLLRESGETAVARSLLTQALQDDPRQLFCWLELLRTLAVEKAWDESDRVLQAARRQFGSDPLLDQAELRLLLKTGRVGAAAAVVARLQQVYPAWQDLQGLAARFTDRK